MMIHRIMSSVSCEIEGALFMTRGTQVLSLLGGGAVLLLGGMKLYQEGEWILLILGLLIVAFTLSNIVRSSQPGNDGDSSRG
jgi:hypothetical protein